MVQKYLILALCIAIGQLIHLLNKAHAMKKRAIAGNISFNPWGDFIKKDIFQIATSFAAGAAVMLMFSELVGLYPKLELVQKIFFVLIGYCGSSLVLSAFSKAEKQMQKAIDNKTNQLDSILSGETYEWVLDFENVNDRASLDGVNFESIDDFVDNTGGVLIPSATEVIYATQPSFTSVTFRRQDTTTYIAGPIRRPK